MPFADVDFVVYLTFSLDGSRFAYTTIKGGTKGEKFSLWINDRRVFPEFDSADFVQWHFKKKRRAYLCRL